MTGQGYSFRGITQNRTASSILAQSPEPDVVFRSRPPPGAGRRGPLRARVLIHAGRFVGRSLGGSG